jgi:hypothetical protein
MSNDSLSVWQKLSGSLFYYPDRFHSGLVRGTRWVAVVSLALAVAAVAVENNLDFNTRQIGLLRENVVGPIFLVSLAVLFVLWVRRNVKER